MLWGVAILVGLVVIMFGIQLLSARSSLNQAAAQAQVLQEQIVAGDATAARRTLASLQDAADDAHGASDGVLWKIGGRVPLLGKNIQALRTVSAELDRLSDNALPSIVDLADRLNAKSFSPADGAVDIDVIREVGPGVAQSAEELSESARRLNGIDADSLMAPLRGPIAAMKYKVQTAAAVATNADRAARLLPAMLGEDNKTRRYALLVQNNAESRSGGGIIGSYAVITVKNGRMSLGTQGSALDLRERDKPIVKLSDDERTVFPSSMASDIRDVTVTPDFPRAASIATKLMSERFDLKLDGAVLIDPVAMSYLLGGLGPIDLGSNIVLDQHNSVTALLHQVYQTTQDPLVQDEFFEDVTRETFDRFKAGAGDPQATLAALVRGIEENRVALWSAHKAEQDEIAPTDLSGVMARDDGEVPHVGFYVSDAASGKMEYFLSSSTNLAAINCLDGGRQVLRLTADLSSTAPASGLALSVTGSGEYVAKGSMRLNIRIVAPFGGHFTTVRLDDQPQTVYADELYGRNVTKLEVILQPGQRRTIVANVTTGPKQTGLPVLSSTPLVDSLKNDAQSPSACG